jgi:hypothetical protein
MKSIQKLSKLTSSVSFFVICLPSFKKTFQIPSATFIAAPPTCFRTTCWLDVASVGVCVVGLGVGVAWIVVGLGIGLAGIVVGLRVGGSRYLILTSSAIFVLLTIQRDVVYSRSSFVGLTGTGTLKTSTNSNWMSFIAIL